MEKILSLEQLMDFTIHVFEAMGCSKEHAQLAADSLVAADLSGVDSHGVARLSGYFRLWETGRIQSNPSIKILHETPSTALVDADRALGLVSAPFAMKLAIEKARVAGTGWVAVRNSNHFGIAGQYAAMAVEQDMIGFAMTNASALVAPTFSRERMLGTNPIAMAVPAGSEPAFVADFATTTASNGKLEILQRKGHPAPEGWVQDASGHSSTDSAILKNGGAMLPLGGDREHGSHKGFMLGSMVDILSGVLSGANFGPWVPPFPAYVAMPENQPGQGLGHFFGAMRVDAFEPASEFKARMDQWIRRFRNAELVQNGQRVVIPGDPERAAEQNRREHGIPLTEPVLADLEQLANRLNLNF
jgi:LDH2 family malate/lactate/ureidoglycolate dehydrogenase